MTQTRREREEQLMAACVSVPLSCVHGVCEALRAAHAREDAIRALPRHFAAYDPDFGTHMLESEHGCYIDKDDVLTILNGQKT